MVETRCRIAGPTDIETIERVPLDRRAPFRSTYEVIRQAADKQGDRPAITFLRQGSADETPVVMTYRDLLSRVNQAANLFTDLGVGPTDTVSYLLPNLPQTHVTIWGGQTAGIVNAINPLLKPEQIAHLLDAAGSRVLVTLGPMPGSDIWERAEAVRGLYPKLETILQVGGQVGGSGDGRDGIHAFDAMLDGYPADRLVTLRDIAPDDVCALFHTGGTTGAPKLVQHTHRNEVYAAWALACIGDFTPDDVALLGLPLFHVNAVLLTGLAPFMAGASTVLLSPAGYRNPVVIRDFWKIVARYRATLFSAVPTVYGALLDVPVEDADIGSLRYGTCGAAPMPVEVFRAFEQRTGIKILEGYGLTEATVVSSANPLYGERRVGSIGLRLPYQAMKAVRLDDQGRYEHDCATGEIGVIAVKGPNVTPGYRHGPMNEALFLGDGWLNTGDLGRRDDEGYFWLVGRAKDMIKRGGHIIDPAMIEEGLHRHPAVALAAAIGKPDAYAGELPIAYVTLKAQVAATPEELAEWSRMHVADPAAAPAEIVILDEMPVTAIGKIYKPALRQDAIRRTFEVELRPIMQAGIGIAVAVENHEFHGTVAIINVSGVPTGQRDAVRGRILRALGRYPIKAEVRFESNDKATRLRQS
jgi:fatty-acyl-CoA synthase